MFLLAALNVLEPLYEGFIERLGMTATLQGDYPSPGDRKGSPLHDTTELFLLHNAGASREAVYGWCGACPRPGEERGGSRRYLILKSIILNNLYGVDISKEAIEICKLRLLLKLVACIERMEDIESLPDIDRNIRVGNALIGFASYEETRRATLGEDQLCLQANELRTKLDYYLAREDGIDPNNALTFEQWRTSRQPFHWCVEFDKIKHDGGFDVIIGNPPYVEYSEVKADIKGSLPKVGQYVELAILKKLTGQPSLRSYIGHGDKALYYHNCPVNWIRATTFVPRFQSDRDGMKVSSQIRQVTFLSEELRDAAVCIINSTLFFWFWLLYSDCYHLTEREIGGFPINLDQLAQRWCDVLSSISDRLMHDYKNKSRQRTYVYKTTGRVVYDEFYPKLSKPIIDDIDRVLARHYGFSDEELDFIIHYEIKYRMGRE